MLILLVKLASMLGILKTNFTNDHSWTNLMYKMSFREFEHEFYYLEANLKMLYYGLRIILWVSMFDTMPW